MKRLLKHRAVSFLFLAGFVLVVFGWLRALFALKKVSQPLIVHFNSAAGINQIGGLWDLSAVAAFGLVCLAVDFLISLDLDAKDQFLGKITAAAGFSLAVLIFIGFSAIISVN